MLDLNNFILNSSSSMEPSVNVQEPFDLEQADDWNIKTISSTLLLLSYCLQK